MQVWLRADSGVICVEGAVSQWQDRSTHGNDATQARPADRPMHVKGSFGGRPVLRFHGGGERLEFATGFDRVFDGDFTIFSLIAPADGYPGRDNVWFGLNAGSSRVVLNN